MRKYLEASKTINDTNSAAAIEEEDASAAIEAFFSAVDYMDFTMIGQNMTIFALGPPIGLGDVSLSMDMSDAEGGYFDAGMGLSHSLPADRAMLAAMAGVPPEMLPDETQVLVEMLRFPDNFIEIIVGPEETAAPDRPGDPYMEALADAGTEIIVSGTQIRGADYRGTLTGGVVAGAEGFFGQIIGELWGLDALMAMVSGLPPEQQQQAMQALGMLTFMGRAEPDGNGENRLIYDIAFEKSGAILINGEVIQPAGAQ